jgi:hypothetical protein
MGEVTLEMLQKLMLDLQAEVKDLRGEMQRGFAAQREEQARTNQKIDAQSTTVVGMRRDVRSLQSEVVTLLSAVDDHSRRIAIMEKPDDQPHA